MKEIGVRELKERASDVIRSVREEKESFLITYRGRAVARLAPIRDRTSSEEFEDIWAQMDKLAEEISSEWPEGVSAVEAVCEQRR